MGSKYNKSQENEEENNIRLARNDLIEFVAQKIKNFKNKKSILSILRIYLNSHNNNTLTEPYKWTNYKDGKYTEKGIELFSFELKHYNNDEFDLKYYFYYGYYIKYYDFHFENEKEEKNFRDIVMSIDENFDLEKKKNKLSEKTGNSDNAENLINIYDY